MSEFPLEPSPDLYVNFYSGNENNPGCSSGRVDFELNGDGRVELKNYRRAGQPTLAWTARASDGAVARLLEALRAANFPTIDRIPPPPAGSDMRFLVVRARGQEARIFMPFHSTHLVPGYKAVFELLDSMVHQASASEVQLSGDRVPGLITGSTRLGS